MMAVVAVSDQSGGYEWRTFGDKHFAHLHAASIPENQDMLDPAAVGVIFLLQTPHGFFADPKVLSFSWLLDDLG